MKELDTEFFQVRSRERAPRSPSVKHDKQTGRTVTQNKHSALLLRIHEVPACTFIVTQRDATRRSATQRDAASCAARVKLSARDEPELTVLIRPVGLRPRP